MGKLTLEIGAIEMDARLHHLLDALTSLKEIPKFPFEHFHRLLLGLLPEISVSFDPAAASTGDLRAICGISRNLELVTAAVTALQNYLHDLRPCDAFGVETER